MFDDPKNLARAAFSMLSEKSNLEDLEKVASIAKSAAEARKAEIESENARATFWGGLGKNLSSIVVPLASMAQGRSVLRSVTGDLGFPRAEMSESIRDNPNRRLSHAGVAIGDFALDPRPSSRGRQAVRFGDGVALLDLGDGRRRQLLPANA